MFIETLIFSIIVGLIRKGYIKNFALIHFRGISFLFVAFFIQIVLDLLGMVFWSYWGLVIHLTTYLLLFYFFWQNKGILHPLLPVGTFLNFIVIVANKGAMPVKTTYMPEESIVSLLESVTHTIMTLQTKLPLLADIIYIKWPVQQMISVGDIVMNIGMFIFIQEIMKNKGASN